MTSKFGRLGKFVQLGLSFSPAGLLTPFHMGVRSQMERREARTDLLASIIDLNAYSGASTPLAGASGGALAAVTAALELPPEDSLAACEEISDTFSRGGTLRQALDPVLDALIPQDAAERLNARSQAHPCTVSYYQVFPTRRAEHVTSFEGRNDLLDCLRASCGVPLYFNGLWPPVQVRSAYAIDGIFASPLSRFGCPDTGADFEFLSCPFPATNVGLSGVPGQSCIISPSLLVGIVGALDSSHPLPPALSRTLSDAVRAGVDVPLALAAAGLSAVDRLAVALRPASESTAERLIGLRERAVGQLSAVGAAGTDTGRGAVTSAQLVYGALYNQVPRIFNSIHPYANNI